MAGLKGAGALGGLVSTTPVVGVIEGVGMGVGTAVGLGTDVNVGRGVSVGVAGCGVSTSLEAEVGVVAGVN